MEKTCVGVKTRTGSSQCWTPPKWAVYDGPQKGEPDRWACDKHLHNAMHPARVTFVLPRTLVEEE